MLGTQYVEINVDMRHTLRDGTTNECVSRTFHETLSADAIPLRVKELVGSVERGHRHIENAHFADRAMPAARLDENRIAGPDRMPLAVELNLASAFEDVVDFRHPLVVVGSGVSRDFHHMQRRHAVRVIDKRPPRLPAPQEQFTAGNSATRAM